MKRSIAVMVCLLVCAAFVFSGGQTADVSGEKEGYVIGLSNFSVANSWRVQMIAEAEHGAEQNGKVARLVVTNSEGSVEKQISDLEDLIAQKVDAIVVTAANPKAVVPVIARARQAGIVVVDFDNVTASDEVNTRLIVDNVEFGRVLAEWLVEELDGKGNIVVFNGIEGTQGNADRWGGGNSVFKNYPGINIVQTVYASWDYAQAKRAMEDVLSAYPKIDGVWSQGGAMSEAVIETYLERGLRPVPVTGEDGNGFLKIWKKVSDMYPGYESIAASFPTWLSAEAINTAVRILEGEQVPKEMRIPVPTITQDELDEYVRVDLPDSYWCNSKLPAEKVSKLFER